MTKLYKSFRLKFVVLYLLVLLSIFVTIHVTIYYSAKRIIEEQMVQNAQGIAVAIARSIMRNVDDYKTLIETKDVNSDFYKSIREDFADIKTHSNVEFIYTERKIDAETVEFILDAEPADSPDYSPPGVTEATEPEAELVYASGIPGGYKPKTDPRWGQLFGAYAPIFDQNGELLGLVGVDISSTLIAGSLTRLQTALFLIYACITAVSLFVIIKYSHAILEPVFKDKLTGAYVKRYCETLTNNAISAAAEGNKDLALLMFDLDHFKKINDTYGHSFGDTVLAAVSGSILGSLRQHDPLIRYGGEEFITLIPNVDERRTLEIAERIRRAVEEKRIYNQERKILVHVTISIGVARLDHFDSKTSARTLIDKADKALYQAKKTRNSVSLWES